MTEQRIRGVAILLAVAGAAFLSQAQQSAPLVATPEIGGANLPALPVGPDDLVAVSVFGLPDLSRTVRVSSEGTIRMPMLTKPIRAMGLLPSALEAAIAQALISEQVLVDPVVTVTMVEYRSHPISVAGAVKKPITFQAVGNVTLLDALTRAEGLSKEAGPEILVSRTLRDETGKERTLTERIPVKSLIDAADPDLNLKLDGGEEIRVPEAGKVFVVGNVKKPGAFAVDDTDGTTILKALALSEGLLPYASTTAYIYRREGGPGTKKNEIQIPLQRVIQRKAADVPLIADDILYIPDRTGRRATMSTLEKILLVGGGSLGAAAIYATR